MYDGWWRWLGFFGHSQRRAAMGRRCFRLWPKMPDLPLFLPQSFPGSSPQSRQRRPNRPNNTTFPPSSFHHSFPPITHSPPPLRWHWRRWPVSNISSRAEAKSGPSEEPKHRSSGQPQETGGERGEKEGKRRRKKDLSPIFRLGHLTWGPMEEASSSPKPPKGPPPPPSP